MRVNSALKKDWPTKSDLKSTNINDKRKITSANDASFTFTPGSIQTPQVAPLCTKPRLVQLR